MSLDPATIKIVEDAGFQVVETDRLKALEDIGKSALHWFNDPTNPAPNRPGINFRLWRDINRVCMRIAPPAVDPAYERLNARR